MELHNSNAVPGKMSLQWIEHWDVLSFLIIVSAKVLYYGKQVSPDRFDIRLVQSPVIASVLTIAAIAYLFREKGRIKFLYIVNIIISIVLIADTVYFRNFMDVISLGALKNGFLFKNILTNTINVIEPFDFIYFLDLVCFIPLVKIMKTVRRKQLSFNGRLIIFSVIFCLGITLDGKFIYKFSGTQPHPSTQISSSLYLTNSLGSINYHVLDIYNLIIDTVVK
ncbi:hypothetical protein HMPREF1982_00673 [Clostridiales bacterium oral taxon 876 str. F0540]|nr:hypothetical protein HMPREF1982_00673 [Clostridiales bacterium oral taxon 876 str. F0540]